MSESTEAPGQEGQGDELKSEYKAFREQVENASALLEFIIAEGHPYKVPDQIIETIECAREILKTSKLPPCTKRVEFLKAYRDLIAIPDTSVSFQGIPPTRFLSLMWLTGAFLTALVPLAIFFVAMNLQSPAQSTVCKFWQAYWFLVLLYPFVAVFTVWGFYVFTGVVTDHKLNQIIAFCYIFTILALLGATLPWWLVSLPADTGAPVALLQGCAEETGNDEIPSSVKCGNMDYQWVLNIGGVVGPPNAEPTSTGQQPVKIRGGVVVPLFVLVFALFGGAVSMTRRVPEYQRRAMSGRDPMTNEEARENLVFQIMQLTSAPLIAIAAYYMFRPPTPMWSAVLGFGSGFASEAILLLIRDLVEKLSPTDAPKRELGTIRVDPSNVNLKPGQSNQFKAHVEGLQNPDVMWLIVPPDAGSISQAGYYTAPKESGKTVTVTARSVADGTRSGSASVRVDSAGTNEACHSQA